MNHHASPAVTPVPIAADAPELQTSADMLDRLARRRSVPLRAFADAPIPAEDLDRILALAARTPDHGRLAPWRFIVIEGEARGTAGSRFDALYQSRNPDLAESKHDMWTLYMLRAPVTVVLVSRPDPAAKIPVWDQELSAGAVGMSFVVAVSALGYGVQWLLKWPGRDPEAASILGVTDTERVAGFLHIGRQTEAIADRPRPDMASLVTRWAG